jgi:CRISPR/Cas system-associated exonuclease Cas4 (RecB family)
MSERRKGQPYIWVTWLAKLLGGNQCLWSAWFKAHFKYEKFNEMAMDLVKWNRDHNRLMAQRRKELEEDGWTVFTEEQNAFKLQGSTATVAGKPDIVAAKDGQILVVDGKTGRVKDSDVWQVLFYLYAIPKSRPDLKGELVGEVQYANGETFAMTPNELDEKRMGDIVSLIKVIASDEPPKKVPSRDECKRCDIGFGDCPERVGAQQEHATAVGEW